MTAYVQLRFRPLLFIDCYLLFIFFVIILKIFLKTIVYVNINRIFTSELKTTTTKKQKLC